MKFSAFMDPEGSLPYSQQLATGLYPELLCHLATQNLQH